jgi:hypothetical protein
MESSSGSNIESLITSILAAATGTVTRLLRFSEYPDNHHLLVVVLYEKLRYCTEITGMHNPQFQESRTLHNQDVTGDRKKLSFITFTNTSFDYVVDP